MRPDALRPATAEAAITTKLATRLSKGEKPNRKRVATVGAVYHVTPVARGPCDILAGGDQPRAPAPVAAGKWLTAGVREDAAAVIARVFDEAERRDPDHVCPWVVLVDGNNHQIDVIRAQARARRVGVHIVVDYIHVLEYVWAAAWSLHDEGDPDAETWCNATPAASWAATPAASQQPSATSSPSRAWNRPAPPTPSAAPTTSPTRRATWATASPWRWAGPSPPASSKEPAAT